MSRVAEDSISVSRAARGQYVLCLVHEKTVFLCLVLHRTAFLVSRAARGQRMSSRLLRRDAVRGAGTASHRHPRGAANSPRPLDADSTCTAAVDGC